MADQIYADTPSSLNSITLPTGQSSQAGNETLNLISKTRDCRPELKQESCSRGLCL